MAAPYSVDLRQKILLALEERDQSQREIAELFHVSQSFIESLLRHVRATGRIDPKPHARGPAARLDEPARRRLRDWLAEQPDLTLAEVAERLQRECGIQVCLSLVCRVLQKLGLSRKKRRSTRPNATRKRGGRRARRTATRLPSGQSSAASLSMNRGQTLR